MKGKEVVFVVAYEGYQQEEYNVPKKLLEAANISVITASNKAGAAIAKDGSTTKIDVILKDLKLADYEGLVFIGGPGALENLDNETSYKLIQQANQADKVVGAICASTRILARAGILEDKEATGWNADGELDNIYKEYNVTYVEEDVVIDKNIVTAKGPMEAKKFGEALIQAVSSQYGWG